MSSEPTRGSPAQTAFSASPGVPTSPVVPAALAGSAAPAPGRSAFRDWVGGAITVAVLVGAAWYGVPSLSRAGGEDGPSVDLGSLLSRDTIVRVTETGEGRRYTVTTGDGTVLYADLTAEDLRLHFPDLDPGVLHAGPDEAEHDAGLDAAIDFGG